MPDSINWAKIKYTATQVGVSIDEWMKLSPSETFEMVELHVKSQKGG